MNKKFVHNLRSTNTNSQSYERSLWDKFWRNDEGKVVFWQFPNVWLILWLVVEIVSLLVASHRAEIITWWVATVALSVWALLEIFRGVNYFRRLLGLLVAVLIILSIIGVGL